MQNILFSADLFFYTIYWIKLHNKMSMIKREMPMSMMEPEEFDEPQQEQEEYQPQHPALVFHAQLQQKTEKDHLDNYVEVKPFEN